MDAAGPRLHNVGQSQRQRQRSQECFPAGKGLDRPRLAGKSVNHFQVEPGAFALVAAVLAAAQPVAAPGHLLQPQIGKQTDFVKQKPQYITFKAYAGQPPGADFIQTGKQAVFFFCFLPLRHQFFQPHDQAVCLLQTIPGQLCSNPQLLLLLTGSQNRRFERCDIRLLPYCCRGLLRPRQTLTGRCQPCRKLPDLLIHQFALFRAAHSRLIIRLIGKSRFGQALGLCLFGLLQNQPGLP